MKRPYILIILLSFMLGACSATRVVGHKTADISAPIRQMVLLLDSGEKFKAMDPSHAPQIDAVNKVMDQVFAVVVKRSPEVFAKNNITAKAYQRTGKAEEAEGVTAAQLKEYPYLLTVSPSNATRRKRDGNTSIDMKANVYDFTQNKTVWRGVITYSESSFASIDDRTADKFIVALLTKLGEVGFVRLPSAGASGAEPPALTSLQDVHAQEIDQPPQKTAGNLTTGLSCADVVPWAKENNKWGAGAPIAAQFQKEFDSSVGSHKVVWEVGRELTKSGKDYRIECIDDVMSIAELSPEEAAEKHIKPKSVRFWHK